VKSVLYASNSWFYFCCSSVILRTFSSDFFIAVVCTFSTLAPIILEAEKYYLCVSLPLGVYFLDGFGDLTRRNLDLRVRFVDFFQNFSMSSRLKSITAIFCLTAHGLRFASLVGFPFRIDVLLLACHLNRVEIFILRIRFSS
jgi:hypothetical protein